MLPKIHFVLQKRTLRSGKSQRFVLRIISENNLALFIGDFTGRNATIGVTATDDGKNVFAVVVFFDPSGEWNTLVNTYDYYKDLYTHKYGSPTISKEKNPARSDSNAALMAEVHQGTVVWGCVWDITGGDLSLIHI